MVIVQKGNKQLKINEEAKEMYLSLGFSVIDENGDIKEAGHATDLAAIKAENDTLKAELAKYQSINLEEIEAIKTENVTLKTENDTLKADKKGK